MTLKGSEQPMIQDVIFESDGVKYKIQLHMVVVPPDNHCCECDTSLCIQLRKHEQMYCKLHKLAAGG